jgi:hypothetical protein
MEQQEKKYLTSCFFFILYTERGLREMRDRGDFRLFLVSIGLILSEVPYQTYLQKYNYFQLAKGVINLLARI